MKTKHLTYQFFFCIISKSLLTISFISIITLYSQAQNLSWVQGIGSTERFEQGDQVLTDQFGNIYLTGLFRGTVDFDVTANTTELTSQGTSDAFFAKYNSKQELQWVKSISGNVSESISQITLDQAGNIYMIGTFGGTTDFDPSAGTASLTSAGQDDVFAAKYNANGEYQWAFRIGGSSFDVGRGIVLDNTGNLYITGMFQGTNIDFDPDTAVQNLNAVGSSSSMFVAKYSSSGVYQWAFRVGSSENGKYISVSGIVLNSVGDELIVAGEHRGVADYDPGVGTVNLNESNGTIFIAKYKTNGSYVLAKNFGATDARSLTLDSQNNIYICGNYNGNNVDFDPGTGSSTLTTKGNNDWFIAKYNTSIELQWIQGMGSATGSDFPEKVALDSQNNIYIIGLFDGEFGFNDPSNTKKITAYGSADILLVSYDKNGAYRFANNLGGSDFDAGNDVFVDKTNNGIYLTGYYTGTANFNINNGTTNITSKGDEDIFFALYGESEIDILLNNQAVPTGYTLDFGNITNGSNSTNSTFTIQNSGVIDLILNGNTGSLIQLAGNNASEFSVTQTNVTSPITAANNVTFTVKFTPTSVGSKTATLTITSNDSDEGTYTINLTGNATQSNNNTPEINLKLNGQNIVNGATLDFGNISSSSISADSTFTIENLGNNDLVLNGNAGSIVQLSGTNASDFVLTQSNVASPITAGSNVTFQVRFNPTALGTRTAVLTILSNDTDEANYVINLKGNSTDIQTSLAQNPNNGVLLVGPNPVKQLLNIKVSQKLYSNIRYQLVNQQGKIVLKGNRQLTSSKLSINLNNLSSGHYTLVIDTGNEKFARKIVKY